MARAKAKPVPIRTNFYSKNHALQLDRARERLCEQQPFRYGRSRREPKLTGKVLMSVRTCHVPLSQCISAGRLTMGLCSTAARTVAEPGDVVLIASTVRKNNENRRGIMTRERLVLMALIVDATCTVPRYYCSRPPPWARRRRDRVYAVVSARAPGTRRLDDKRMRDFLQATDDAKLFHADVVEGPTKSSWRVTYAAMPDHPLVFRRKHKTRSQDTHGAVGPNAIPLARRRADFTGRVIASTTFAVFPGWSTDSAAVRWRQLGVRQQLGIGFRVTTLDQNPVLSAWLRKLFNL